MVLWIGDKISKEITLENELSIYQLIQKSHHILTFLLPPRVPQLKPMNEVNQGKS